MGVTLSLIYGLLKSLSWRRSLCVKNDTWEVVNTTHYSEIKSLILPFSDFFPLNASWVPGLQTSCNAHRFVRSATSADARRTLPHTWVHEPYSQYHKIQLTITKLRFQDTIFRTLILTVFYVSQPWRTISTLFWSTQWKEETKWYFFETRQNLMITNRILGSKNKNQFISYLDDEIKYLGSNATQSL